MLRPLLGISEEHLERHLLRRGVGALSAGRHACADCGRTPLVGERVFAFARAATVCALCRGGHREEPQGSSVVGHPEAGHTVRLRPRLAA